MEILYKLLGWIISGIDWCVFQVFGLHNIGLCIVLFTIIVYTLMIPLNAKQQKSSRLMSKINPEIQAIQAKYKGKKDTDSMTKMQTETQAVYNKYGVSPFGGCLPLLISMPIMFALYGVIQKITEYVPSLKGTTGFLGLDVSQTPTQYAKVTKFAYLIPILAVVFQFINTKMLQVKDTKKNHNQEDSMAASMKMMNYFMPLMSGIFCLSLNIGIGLYWITSAIFRIIQAYFINRHVDKISLDDLIEQNREKAAKKNKKREEMAKQMEMYSKQKTSSIKTVTNYQNTASSDTSDKKIDVNKNIEPGSISGYAHMLSGNRKDNK